SKNIGINKAAVTRLLYTLEHAGFLEKNQSTGGYSLTVKPFRIGSVYLSQVDLHTIAMPHLTELSVRYKETTHLAVLHENATFFIHKVESSRSIQIKSLIGSKLPVYCTAIGKVLLAYQDDEFIDQYIQSVELVRYTPTTITDPEALKQHLKEIRSLGYAQDDLEHEPDLKSVAAPVKNHEGKVIAGVSIAGPDYRMQNENLFKSIVTSVVETSEKISRSLGYFPRTPSNRNSGK
ncbi:MAG: IclR family transcriptional regulator, partial [Desulfobacterales bacterium]|nr:IclR family transcriptional regulator [Desulfobacterales bacterium]